MTETPVPLTESEQRVLAILNASRDVNQRDASAELVQWYLCPDCQTYQRDGIQAHTCLVKTGAVRKGKRPAQANQPTTPVTPGQGVIPGTPGGKKDS